MVSLFAAGVMLVQTGTAEAQHYNSVHDQKCDAVEGQGDAGVRECYWQLAAQAEKDRKQSYERIMGGMTLADAKSLAAAESLWFDYRDAFCSTEHDVFDGGTAGLSATPTCRLSLTREHIKQLGEAFGWMVEKP